MKIIDLLASGGYSPLVGPMYQRAIEAWGSIFCSSDPKGWPFTSRAERGLVLYPTDGYMLNEAQFSALSRAAIELGEPRAYLVVTEGNKAFGGDRHTIALDVALDNFHEYAELQSPLENAIYSQSGSWGVLISQQAFAVVGGSARFVKLLAAKLPGAEGQWQSLLEDGDSDETVPWLQEIKEHMG